MDCDTFVDVKLVSESKDDIPLCNVSELFTPGEIVSLQEDFMKGHGTYIENGYIKASVAGIKEQVGKLISIKPLKSRYVGEIGDVVVGRIIEVQQKRWKVETNSYLDSVLLLSSINLPGGELRRRQIEDEQMMRKFLNEGDLISAEVQNIFDDGSLSLHTRSPKSGKLSLGVLIKVSPSLIKRRKVHYHNLSCGASIILGNNGFIWITTIKNEDDISDGFTQNITEEITKKDREVIARLNNCILALAKHKVMLFDTSISFAFEESKKYEIRDLLQIQAMTEVALLTQQRLNSQVD